MKKVFFLAISVIIGLASCKNKAPQQEAWVDNALDIASYQLKDDRFRNSWIPQTTRSIWTGYTIDFLVNQLERDAKTFQDSLWANPSADKLGQRRLCGIYDWTSGFFPGSLWYLYELTGDNELKEQAIKYTNLLNPVRYYKDTHDLGFMVNCSYGNALRLAPNDTIKNVLIETADNLCLRFDPKIGCTVHGISDTGIFRLSLTI